MKNAAPTSSKVFCGAGRSLPGSVGRAYTACEIENSFPGACRGRHIVTTTVFRTDRLIRFQYCDPAGIVFYPIWPVLFHEMMDDWSDRDPVSTTAISSPLSDWARRPSVRLECSFLAPAVIGETLVFHAGPQGRQQVD